jgi:parvulin-like peptidyl-prolyl isomerase
VKRHFAQRLLRAPLVHFFVLGALFHGALALRPGTIVLDRQQLADLDAQWRRATGRAPTATERAAGRQRAADEEMLVREALRLGLDRSDPVARSRLLRNIALIAPAAAADDEAAALAHARRLDMGARDVLTRRRLVQLMEARLSASDAPLTQRELDAHVAAHPERYAQPSRIGFVHVFLDDGAEVDRIAAALRAGTLDPGAAGAAFAAGNRFESATNGRITALFGAEFATTLMSAPVGQWVRVKSAFGLHLVRVMSRTPEAPGSARDAGPAAVWGALEERERRRLQQGIAELRTHYRVRLGDAA